MVVGDDSEIAFLVIEALFFLCLLNLEAVGNKFKESSSKNQLCYISVSQRLIRNTR